MHADAKREEEEETSPLSRLFSTFYVAAAGAGLPRRQH